MKVLCKDGFLVWDLAPVKYVHEELFHRVCIHGVPPRPPQKKAYKRESTIFNIIWIFTGLDIIVLLNRCSV